MAALKPNHKKYDSNTRYNIGLLVDYAAQRPAHTTSSMPDSTVSPADKRDGTMAMTVKELKDKLAKLPDTIPVVIETTQGQKFHLLTVKKRTLRAGHRNESYCWLPTGKTINSPLDII